MGQTEYERVINLLDAEIERAEKARKREELERQRQNLRSQMEALEERVSKLRSLSVGIPEEAANLLRGLKAQESAFSAEIDKLPAALLLPPTPEPVKGPYFQKLQPLLPEERDEFSTILREVETADYGSLSSEERWTRFEIWADRWRILVDRIGPHAAKGGIGSATFARIRETMNEHGGTNVPYIPALNQGKDLDWHERLREAEQRLNGFEERRGKKREARQKLADLESLLMRDDLSADEAARKLQHAVRDIAREETLRGELADIVEPYRASLGSGFEFLFQNGGKEEGGTHKVKLSNRDIMSRLLRRMVNKGMIGEKYCPVDMIPKGFPPHDLGRAKEALKVLLQATVAQSGKMGDVASLSTEWTAKVKEYLAGKPMCVKAVDEWATD